MVILTQDRKSIVNIQNVTSISSYDDKGFWFIKAYGNSFYNTEYACVDCGSEFLGKYRSERAAKEVIGLICAALDERETVFHMPSIEAYK